MWCLRKNVAVRNQDPSKGVELVLPESWGLRGLLRAVPSCSTGVLIRVGVVMLQLA